ncbi:putative polyol transporter 1 [Iris pallida]|uniref:Polyol transporter 1 n=1 Tax=Iris pallida TaxID=29817 RepID=A0AAX6HRE4_IRIPA|nr:putative polyol transporter 1 [Iris pallida]
MGEQKQAEGKLVSEDMVAPPKRNTRFAFACALLASMTSILLGYDIGVMSGASIFIKDDLHINDTEVEVLLGILNLYSLIGSALAGRTSDWVGRRLTIVLAAAIFFVGALMMGLAPNYAFLMVGRFVAGIGVGYALMIAPVYTAEVSPASSRGFLTSFPEVFINVGILLGYVSNFGFSKLPLHLGWRVMLGIGAVPSVFLGVGVLGMPESPRWLVMQGRLAEAKRVLEKTSDSDEEAALRLADIKACAGIPEDCDDDVVAVPKRSKGEGVWRELLITPTPAVRRILISAVGMHFFQQASGIDSVVLYSPRVFEKAGITDKTELLGTTVAVGFAKTIFILVATFLIDRVGRRPLLLSSVGGMVASLAGLGFGLTVIDRHPDERLTWAIAICIASILLYVAFFSIGLGPITWVYTSEIFPLRLRAQGASIGVGVNRVTSGVLTMTFISLYKAITIGGSFFLYGGVAAVAFVFFYTYLPETRGKTLEEMEEFFGVSKKDVKRKKKNYKGEDMVVSSQVQLASSNNGAGGVGVGGTTT